MKDSMHRSNPLIATFLLYNRSVRYQRCCLLSCLVRALTSVNSTQKAFMFNPYIKLEKFSLNLLMLSCSCCSCRKLSWSVAMASSSSSNGGTSASRGFGPADVVERRKESRDAGRRGVVGRDGCFESRFRDCDRWRDCDPASCCSEDITIRVVIPVWSMGVAVVTAKLWAC